MMTWMSTLATEASPYAYAAAAGTPKAVPGGTDPLVQWIIVGAVTIAVAIITYLAGRRVNRAKAGLDMANTAKVLGADYSATAIGALSTAIETLSKDADRLKTDVKELREAVDKLEADLDQSHIAREALEQNVARLTMMVIALGGDPDAALPQQGYQSRIRELEAQVVALGGDPYP